MPEPLETLRTTKNLSDAKRIQNRLMTAFIADFAKYGRRYDHRKLQQLLAAVPCQAGRKFKFSHVDPDTKARDFKVPLLDLERAGLVRLVRATSASGLPLGAEEKEGFYKAQFLDIGLMLHTLGIDLFSSAIEGSLFINEGALAEQFVGQELIASLEPEVSPQVFYWSREKKNAEAEVDFVISLGSKIIPIEVKAGATGRLKSLRQFMNEKNVSIGIRISQQNLSFHEGILSVPFYMVSQIPRLIELVPQ